MVPGLHLRAPVTGDREKEGETSIPRTRKPEGVGGLRVEKMSAILVADECLRVFAPPHNKEVGERNGVCEIEREGVGGRGFFCEEPGLFARGVRGDDPRFRN